MSKSLIAAEIERYESIALGQPLDYKQWTAFVNYLKSYLLLSKQENDENREPLDLGDMTEAQLLESVQTLLGDKGLNVTPALPASLPDVPEQD